MKQLDLFQWADSKPSNVIDARPRFEAKVVAFVRLMIETNRLPPHIDGKVIYRSFERDRGAA